jgi:hypothetical protein
MSLGYLVSVTMSVLPDGSYFGWPKIPYAKCSVLVPGTLASTFGVEVHGPYGVGAVIALILLSKKQS